MKADIFLKKTISWLFAGMFFLVPLFFTPLNSELFEFNKIILVYIFTALMTGIWLTRIILAKKIIFKRSFLDIPLALFLASQTISTIFSIDPHTSIFGYYSRFNGGLLSTVSYLLLYWAFVSNCDIDDVKKSIKFSLVSAVIVSAYGILEHFGRSFSCLMFGTGFNVDCWVQKVQERVFATLGQPNWLAAYIVVLMPINWALILNAKIKDQRSKLKIKTQNYLPFVIFILFYSCLLFTQSRSGFLGFFLSFAVFWGIIFFLNRRQIKSSLKPFLILGSLLFILVLVFGSPFPQINKLLHYKSYLKTDLSTTQPLSPSTSLDGGISESGDIRKIVWKGAWETFKHYPVFGSGVETFAYAYYNFRPIEHNLVSEWDFLYNKAHNEYLNFLSTTGTLGLGTYLLFIISFVYFNLCQFTIYKLQITNKFQILALFAGWITLLITNFFGFSVVVTSLYFFLLPAFIITIVNSEKSENQNPSPYASRLNPFLAIPLLAVSYLLLSAVNYWRADYFYSQGEKLAKQGKFFESYQKLHQSYQLNPKEPVILSEISVTAANLAYIASQQNEISQKEELTGLALYFSGKALRISPNNLNINKNLVRVFYTLSNFEPEYLYKAIESTLNAVKLAPTDPKLVYNLGLLYGKDNQGELAIETIEKAVEMKPNYVDARNALSIFYQDIGETKKAKEHLEILIKLAPENSAEFSKRMEKLN